MPNSFSRVLTLLAFSACGLAWAEDKAAKDNPKDKEARQPSAVTIIKVDAKAGTLTVKMNDPQGKPAERTFRLTRDVRVVDETGRVVALDLFEAGDEALLVEREGKLEELRRPARAHRSRPSDLIHVLVEMSDCDEGCTEEVQRVYDILRRLDKNKDGKLDADELRSARQVLVEERVDNLMKRLDKDQDGKISREEARGLIKAHFDKLDRNRDGFIDRGELFKAASEREERQRTAPERK